MITILPTAWIMRTNTRSYPAWPVKGARPGDVARNDDLVMEIEDTEGNVLWRRPHPAAPCYDAATGETT